MTTATTIPAGADVDPEPITEHTRLDYRDACHRRVPGRFEVKSVPEYPFYADDPYGDELILVDGWQIGGTYWCGPAGSDPYHTLWASYGPAGFSFNHPTREAATAVQVRAYAVDPDRYERAVADHLAQQQAEAARRDAEREAEADRRAEQRCRQRLGDDEPGPTVATVPAYHHMYAPEDEVRAVCAWLAAHGIDGEDVDGRHPIRVEQREARRVIVYEKPTPGGATQTWVVTLTADPPAIDTPERPDLVPLLEEHWPTYFPLINFGAAAGCAVCTTSPTEIVVWPCEKLTAAIRGGFPTSRSDFHPAM